MELYEFNTILGKSTSLIFSFGCIWIVHSIYKTPRKLWQCILIWVSAYTLAAFTTIALQALFPDILYERLGMYAGIIAVIPYLYLLPHIPIYQRIFVYIFVYTMMYCCILLPRTLSLFLGPIWGIDPNRIFIPLYLLIIVVFIYIMQRYLFKYLKKALSFYQENLLGLTTFAGSAYLMILLSVDPWATTPALSLYQTITIFTLICTIFLGYTLAFRTLLNILEQVKLKSTTETALMQAQLAQREFQSSMERIKQIRHMRHDMTHHFNTIATLTSHQKQDDVLLYIRDILKELPENPLTNHNFITQSFLDYYQNLCMRENIFYEEHIHYDEDRLTNKNQLGILLGNALKNAYEAALDESIKNPFIRVEGRTKGSQIIMIIENSYELEPNIDYSSTKGPNRGFGLESIRVATERNNGYLEISHTNKIFTLKAVLVIE